MAGTGSDSQQQLLSLIRNFAAEKSQGERRVITLKNRIAELKSELSATNAEFEDAKCIKELVEQELKGYEVQLFMSEASAQTLQSRISLTQDEISNVASHLEILKNEEAALREVFIRRMLELNARIRKFQENITCNIDAVYSATPTDSPQGIVKDDNTKGALSALENTLAEIISHATKEEEEYKAEQNTHKNMLLELNNSERKLSLLDNIFEETKALHDLTIQLKRKVRPTRSGHLLSKMEAMKTLLTYEGMKDHQNPEVQYTSKLEATCSSLGEEFQRRCICPHCHLDNSETVSELLQPNE